MLLTNKLLKNFLNKLILISNKHSKKSMILLKIVQQLLN